MECGFPGGPGISAQARVQPLVLEAGCQAPLTLHNCHTGEGVGCPSEVPHRFQPVGPLAALSR